ncbi:hypothetical protein BASA83_008615 [Batrachochytrium salamandrivorans]|nr:hypothetical protein BASA83_008615 [Batrachochytrium salamandrivorans]
MVQPVIEQPDALLLWTKPFGLTTGFLKRKQEQQYNPRPFRRNLPQTQPVSRIQPQQYQHRYVDNLNHHQRIHQPSAPITATPVQQHRTTNDMDIDFARRGPP